MSYQFLQANYHPSWEGFFSQQKSLLEPLDLLLYERAKEEIVYPPNEQIFHAFQKTEAGIVKVVILGQDPYHGPGEAEGLAFSVPPGIKIPPSLRNIFKELQSDLGISPPSSGSLQKWAEQGVLLLNAFLSVAKDKPGSHSKLGWEKFTDAAIRFVSTTSNKAVFILWGKFAQKKEGLVDTNKHLVLKSAHPSPLGARYGFWNSKPFSKTNDFLQKNNIQVIDWQL
ncbi:MAG: uracil-DNA glycosylase [Spirochaetota bacterium]